MLEKKEKNVVGLYAQETTSDLRSAIQNAKENGYDMIVSCNNYFHLKNIDKTYQ